MGRKFGEIRDFRFRDALINVNAIIPALFALRSPLSVGSHHPLVAAPNDFRH